MSARHEELWKRALAAIEARGALAPGAPTAREIAATADRRLRTDLVKRLAEGYYQPRRYGGTSLLSDEEADALVSALEALPPATGEAPAISPIASASSGPTVARSVEPGGSFEAREAEPVGLGRSSFGAAPPRLDEASGDGLEPDSAAAWRALADTQRKAGSLEQALLSLERARALEPGSAATHNLIGVCHFQLGDLTRAMEAYREATRLDPEVAVAWYNLGRSYEELKEYSEAEAALRRYTSVSREDADGWIALGRTLYYLKRDAEALGALQTCLVCDPKRAGAWAWMGWTRSRLQDWSGAAEAFRKATEILPTYTDAWEGLADALAKAGRARESKKARAVAGKKAKSAKSASGRWRMGMWIRRGAILILVAAAAAFWLAVRRAVQSG